jgi:7-cyano-7-deazaguanine reductase
MSAPPDDIGRSPLGHATGYPDTYDPAQLFIVPRALGLTGALPFSGSDIWTAYELTWLDPRGKPTVAVATIEVPAESPSIVESKSMKLYLGSFAQSSYASPEIVATTIGRDLAAAVGAPVRLFLLDSTRFGAERFAEFEGESLDGLAVDCSEYEVDATSLVAGDDHADEALTTNLFRSVCPITGQPDIASVRIAYRGPRIDRAGLLRYFVSYRCHPGFHEHCVERMFVDIAARCRTERLTVHARFTRRGGIDINPFRTDAMEPPPPNLRTARQ